MTPKPPWSVRKDRKRTDQFFVLREGIPEGLGNSLMDFLSSHYTEAYDDVAVGRVERLARVVGRDLPRSRRELLTLFLQDEELLLDAIDHALSYPAQDVYNPYDPSAGNVYERAQTLKSYFDEARSVYDVFHVDGPEFELGYRQPPEITELVEAVTSNRDRASEHLRRAWLLAFSREADPNAACVEATKAIEAAARDTIEPNNSRATLGTMIAAMEAKPTKWATDLTSPDLDGVGTVIGLMKAVWKGHLRHGNPNEPLDVPAERCEMIVHSAALLVHWFTSGRVRQA